MKTLLALIFILISSISLANPSSVSGTQLLTLISQLRGLPSNALLKQAVVHPNRVNILEAAKQMRLPPCVVEKLARVGSRLLSEQQLKVLTVQTRTNHCLSLKEADHLNQIKMIRLNTLKDIARFITAVNPNSLISSSLEKIAPDDSVRQPY